MTRVRLETFLARLRAADVDAYGRANLRELCRRVAAGERHPTEPPLPDSVVIFACQALVVLFDHLEDHPP